MHTLNHLSHYVLILENIGYDISDQVCRHMLLCVAEL